MTTDAPAVKVRGITHCFGARQALRDVSFAVAPGEVFGLLGPNGGGKTTLFRILSTALTPTEGTAEIFGHDVRDSQQSVRSRIGVSFQSASLDSQLTVAERARMLCSQSCEEFFRCAVRLALQPDEDLGPDILERICACSPPPLHLGLRLVSRTDFALHPCRRQRGKEPLQVSVAIRRSMCAISPRARPAMCLCIVEPGG